MANKTEIRAIVAHRDMKAEKKPDRPAMLAQQQIKQRISEFLSTSDPVTICIRGAWGTGKTYAWKEWVEDTKDELQNERYSYVSLFGIDSLKDLRLQIFQQALPRAQIGQEVSIKSLRNNTINTISSTWRKGLKTLSYLPHANIFTDAMQSVAFLSMNKSLICLDDLERKGKNLSMSDVLGLITHLKEDKKCKVVIICNEGEINNKDEKEEFDKYRDKVIDIEFEYKPSASECTSIAFQGDGALRKQLTDNCTKLGIDNIRILNKIEQFATELKRHVEGLDPEVLYQSLRTLCLYVWCRYSSDDVSPDYKHIKDQNTFTRWLMMLEKDHYGEEKDAKWRAVLGNYGYYLTNLVELDPEISSLIEVGYIKDHDEFNKAAKEVHEKAVAMKGDESFTEAWEIYHHSFKNNGDEVAEKLFKALKKHAKYVTPNNLQGTVGVLRGLGRDDWANEAIDYYVEQHKNEPGLFELDSPFSENIRDKRIIERFNEISASTTVEHDIDAVVRRVANKDSWSQEDEQALVAATVDDYYKLFKSIDGDYLSKYVSSCLQFGRFANPSDQQKKIHDKAASALKRIAGESDINKLRLERFGIVPDDDKDNSAPAD